MPRIFTPAIAFVVVSLVVPHAKCQPTSTPGKVLALYAPRPYIPEEALAKHLTGAGVCLLHLRSDGTVARAEMIQSTGQPLLDKATVDCFSKWRFVPATLNKTKKIKIPITYTNTAAKTLGI